MKSRPFNLIRPTIATLLLVFVGLQWTHCAPLTDNQSKEVITGKTEPVGADGAAVAIDGADVTVPAGALAVGSEVAVRNGDVPGEFKMDDVTSLSKALEVSAVGPDGSPISEADQPLTISIDYAEGASLALVSTEADLCVLAKAATGLFVWRRAALTVGGTLVTFKSKVFGTFQVVYCGTKALKGFSEVNRTITGESPVSTTMIVPADTINFGHGKYCVLILAGSSEEEDESSSSSTDGDSNDHMTVIGVAEADATLGTEQSIAIDVGPSDVINGREHYVVNSHVNTGATCPFKLGDNITDESEFSHLAMFAFKVENAALKAGLSGTLHANGPFATTPLQIKIDNVLGETLTTETKGCVDVDVNDGGKAQFYLPISSTSAGFAAGTATVYEATGTSTSTERDVTYSVGRNCVTFDRDYTSDLATGKPFFNRFPAQEFPGGNVLTMVPVKLRILLPALNGCIEIFPGGSLASGANLEDNQLFEMLIALSAGGPIPAVKEVEIYIPKLSSSTYDYRIKVVEADQTCQDSQASGNPETLENQPYARSVNIPVNIP